MLQEPLQDKPCDCHDIPSNTAGARATRLEYISTTEDKKILIQEYKTKLAQIYTSISNLEAPKTEDNQLNDTF